jgi:diguanylate cyclase (GGDEF)-like protein
MFCMGIAPLPQNEEERLRILADYDILDTAAEKIFDSITMLASQLCDIPVSLIVFIDKDRQWFKSKYGLPEGFQEIQETSRDVAFCAHTILSDNILEVEDLTKDQRFSDNPFVTESPNIRFYAGIPLATEDGINVGSLCVLDTKPRHLSEAQKISLKNLSTIVMTLMEAKKNISEITLLGQALQTSSNEIYLFNSQSLNCIYANQAALLNVSTETDGDNLFDFSFEHVFINYTAKDFFTLLSPLFSKEKEFLTIETIQKSSKGDIYPSELRIQLSFTKKDPILIIVSNNISERKLVEKKINELNSLLEKRVEERTKEVNNSLAFIKATLQSTTDAIFVTNKETDIVDYNSKLLNHIHVKNLSEKITLKHIFDELDNPEMFINKLDDINAHPYQKSFDELIFKSGKIIECHSQPQIVNESVMGRVWCLRDVTAKKNLQDQLIKSATCDPLTNIPNRLLLEDRIEQALLFAKSSNNIFALLFIDLDRFKSINDGYGHHCGDELLKLVADRLKIHLRPTDSVARIGGDEFVILLTPLNIQDDIGYMTQRIQQEISKPCIIEGNTFEVSSSIGVSVYPKDGLDTVTLIKNADTAMFRSKEIYNNAINFYAKEMNTYVMKRLELENYLNLALKNNELVLNFQPLLDLSTGKVFGCEALVRWQHPILGMVPPMEFIPIAESTGTILPIGEWVFKTACLQLNKWHSLFNDKLVMSINVSSQQFKHPNFLTCIQTILHETKVNPTCIEIELTESLMLGDINLVIQKMQKLNDLGLKLVIDDFGTGYSSLSYLTKLPIDKLKIDKSFVHSLSSDIRDAAIIQTIIEMSKNLKIKVLAEGVETESQLKFLNNNHCDQLQGYLLSKPMEPVAFEKFLQTYETSELGKIFRV